MARAHSVWVLTNRAQEPAHAFTVKHELLTFLRGHVNTLHHRTVFKLADGAGGTAVFSWPATEFLATND